MTLADLERIFVETLDDKRLSRSERQALQEVFAGLDPELADRQVYLGRAVDAALAALEDPRDRDVLEWLHDVVRAIYGVAARTLPEVAEARFAPRDDIAARIRSLLDSAGSTVDICVFTITDDSVTAAILRAHARGLRVRILTDDEKTGDRGSDVDRLRAAGISVRTDRSEDHMHHKFAVLDRRVLVNGSYNWTRSAAERNFENIAVTDDIRLVGDYLEEFERLWEEFDPSVNV